MFDRYPLKLPGSKAIPNFPKLTHEASEDEAHQG